MARRKAKWAVSLLATLAAFGVGGWALSNAASQRSQGAVGEMTTIRQMMANAPPAMKRCQTAIEEQKQTAMKAGKYICCLRHPCNFCAEHMGQCPCGKNVIADKPVCNECKGAWYAGDGAIPNKTPDQIKTLPRPLGM